MFKGQTIEKYIPIRARSSVANMRMVKKFLCIIVLIPIYIIAFAQTSLGECRQAARENYPEIRKFEIIKATRDCNLKNASMAWLPQVQIGGQFSWVNNVNNIDDLSANADPISSFAFQYVVDKLLHLESERPWQYAAGVSVAQNIWDGGASTLRKTAARAEAEKMEAEVEVNLQAVEEQVDEVYFSILLLERRLELTESRIGILMDNFKKLKNQHREGFVSDMYISKMDVEILSTEQIADEIRSGIKVFRISLSLLTGMNMADKELAIPAEPVTGIVFRRPEYLLLESKKKMLDLQNKKLDVELMPKIGLYADAGYGYPNRNVFMNLTGFNPTFNAQAGIRVIFNLSPLYTRSRDKSIISNQMEMLNVQGDILNFKFGLEKQQLTQEEERLRECLRRDKRILEQRTRIRIAEEKRLEEGEIDLTELLESINEENTAALQLDIHSLTLLKTLHQQSRTGM